MPEIQSKPGSDRLISVQENKTFRERLIDRFAPHEYVRVKNLDDEPLEWEWMPSTGEQESFTDNGAVRVISGRRSFTSDFSHQIPGNERRWVMNAGDEEVLLGENAYLMIEALYKKLVTKQVVAASPNQEQTKARNFNWNDGKRQEETINKIIIRVEKPNFDAPAPVSKKA